MFQLKTQDIDLCVECQATRIQGFGTAVASHLHSFCTDQTGVQGGGELGLNLLIRGAAAFGTAAHKLRNDRLKFPAKIALALLRPQRTS